MSVLLAAAALAGLAVLGYSMSPALRLTIAAWLFVGQVFVPGVPQTFSGFQVWAIAAMLPAAWAARPAQRHPGLPILLGFIGVTAVAALWSVEPTQALITILQVLALVAVALTVASVVTSDGAGRALRRPLIVMGLSIAAEAALVIAFRMSPGREDRFLHSRLAEWLVGTSKLANLWGPQGDNVRDVVKAGGLWTNANTASMFLGVAGMVMLLAWRRWRSTWALAAGCIALVAIPFAGSKSGLVLLVLVPVTCLLMAKMVATGKYFWAAFILAAVTLVQGPISNSVLERFSNGATGDWSTVSTRWVIWDIGVRLFAEHPLLGLGYGGWGPAFQQASGNVLGRSFPPHNFVLQAWADGGALSALLVLAFVAAVVRSLWRRVRFAEPQDVTDWALVAAGFAWLWLHGLGDATAFFGDIRTVTLVGVLLGLTWMGLPAREHPREDTAVAVGSTTAAAPPTSVVEKAPIQVVQDVRLPVKIKPV